MKGRFSAIFGGKYTHRRVFMALILLIIVLLAGTLVGFKGAEDGDSSPVKTINITVTGCNVINLRMWRLSLFRISNTKRLR